MDVLFFLITAYYIQTVPASAADHLFRSSKGFGRKIPR